MTVQHRCILQGMLTCHTIITTTTTIKVGQAHARPPFQEPNQAHKAYHKQGKDHTCTAYVQGMYASQCAGPTVCVSKSDYLVLLLLAAGIKRLLQ